MPFRWEVDDVLRIVEPFSDEHPARLNFAALARSRVSLEIVWERLFELQGDTAAHNTDAIDGVYQSLDFRPKDVASSVLDHRATVSVIPVRHYHDSGPVFRFSYQISNTETDVI